MFPSRQTLLCLMIALSLGGCQNNKYLHSTQGVQTTNLPLHKVKKGMSQEEVTNLLGTPHINPKKPDQWSYLYLSQGVIQDKVFQVIFQNNKVHHMRTIRPKSAFKP